MPRTTRTFTPLPHDRISSDKRRRGDRFTVGVVEPVQLSGLMTFFFSIFYLQWAINKYVGGRACLSQSSAGQ